LIKDLDELTALLKICRKQGVTDIKFEGVSIVFGELPKKSKDDVQEDPKTEGPTDEELMNWSVGAQ
jgi:hypothetical protein